MRNRELARTIDNLPNYVEPPHDGFLNSNDVNEPWLVRGIPDRNLEISKETRTRLGSKDLLSLVPEDSTRIIIDGEVVLNLPIPEDTPEAVLGPHPVTGRNETDMEFWLRNIEGVRNQVGQQRLRLLPAKIFLNTPFGSVVAEGEDGGDWWVITRTDCGGFNVTGVNRGIQY